MHKTLYHKLVLEEKGHVESIDAERKLREKVEKSERKKFIQTRLTKEITIRFSIRDINDIIVDLITKAGIPLRLLNSPAFKRLLNPILRQLGS